MIAALGRKPPLLVFLTAALTVYTVELFVVRSAPASQPRSLSQSVSKVFAVLGVRPGW